MPAAGPYAAGVPQTSKKSLSFTGRGRLDTGTNKPAQESATPVRGRKLYAELEVFFEQNNIRLGRDKFFELLRRNKLLVRKRKHHVCTTMSKHHFRRYPNLVKDFTPLKAHELWVADITYISTVHRHAYLFLITDAYSRKIVGFHLGDDMKVSSGILALKKALAQKPADAIVIHHSDRGLQYCSTEYTNLLLQNNCMISMTQNGDPYENAIAERVNGILKTELISSHYKDVETASTTCSPVYNYLQPPAKTQQPQLANTRAGAPSTGASKKTMEKLL